MRFDRLKEFLTGRDEGDGPPRIGRYELREEIARGGMSVVWKAYDPELDRLVAVKVLRDGSLDRLRREAIAAARLRHPHIVTVHEVGPDYIVMDLVPGRTLADAMGSLPLEARLEILETVARAVHHAHEHGVVHRDLKPGNILLEEGGRVLLTDFGLAKLTGGRDLTVDGAVLGTPAYMAPEQVAGRGQAPAVDVWALGVLLYEMASGRRPFEGETPLALFDRITRGTPRLLPGPLGRVAARALEKDPARRYSSAAAFADEIARHRRGEPVQAGPPRRRAIRAAAAGAVLVAAAAALVLLAGPPSAPAPDELGDWRRREQELTRQIELEPGRIAALIARAEVRERRGDFARDHGRNALPDYTAAEADLTAALALDPDAVDARLARGRIRVQRAAYKRRHGVDPGADCDSAEEDLNAVLPHRPQARAWLANARFHRGLWREAGGEDGRLDFEAADRLLDGADDADMLMRRGRIRAHLDRFAEAERDFEASLALQPGPWAWTWRGLARVRAGDLAAAERHFGEAIRLRPTFADAWAERGRVRLARGDFAAAAGDLAEAIRHDPTLEPLLAESLRQARDGRPPPEERRLAPPPR